MLQFIKLSLIFLLINFTSQSFAAENLDQIYQEANELTKHIFIQVDENIPAHQTKLKSIVQTYIPTQGVIFTLIPELDNIENIYLQDGADSDSYLGHSDLHDFEASENKDLTDEQKSRIILKDLSHKLRDMQKASIHLQKESKQAKTEHEKKQIDSQLRQVHKQKQALHIEKHNIVKRHAEGNYTQQLQQQTQLTNKQRVAAANRKDFFQQITQDVLVVLCQSRQILPSIPSSENISLVLQQGGDKMQDRFRDSIMLFALEDVSACASEEINTNELFNNSVRYQF